MPAGRVPATVDGRLSYGGLTLWEADGSAVYAGFGDHGIPLVHQLGVAAPFRRLGIATLLTDSAEELARERFMPGLNPLGQVVRARPPGTHPTRTAHRAFTQTISPPADNHMRSALSAD
jgi:GNAT superfamily N-acetyltransferase